MSDAPELKPCPFCGGKPYLANVAMVGCAYVVCTDCRVQTDDMSKDSVIERWNTRTDLCIPINDPALVALVDAAQYLLMLSMADLAMTKRTSAALAAYTTRIEGTKP